MVVYKNELYHHGVKGMRWGVRRYQKKNGELTSRGLARQKSREEYIARLKRSNISMAEENKKTKQLQKMSDKKLYEKTYGKAKPKDLGFSDKKEAIKYARYDLAKTIRVNNYQSNENKKYINKINSTPIGEKSIVEVEKSAGNIGLGISAASSILYTGAMSYASVKLGNSKNYGIAVVKNMIPGVAVGLTTGTIYYAKKTGKFKQKQRYD